jgi:hypothetical protein
MLSSTWYPDVFMVTESRRLCRVGAFVDFQWSVLPFMIGPVSSTRAVIGGR